MKTIYIDSPKHGIHEVFVDDEDYNHLLNFKWTLHKGKTNIYARRTYRENGKKFGVFIHREIFNFHNITATVIDHIDHNGLNCQKQNMRACTYRQNSQNKRKQKNSTSQYLGVYKRSTKKHNGKEYFYIGASIKHEGTIIYIGNFSTEIEAAIAYDKKAKELFGEFSNLNFKQQNPQMQD
jgi:hypothetical protein